MQCGANYSSCIIVVAPKMSIIIISTRALVGVHSPTPYLYIANIRVNLIMAIIRLIGSSDLYGHNTRT